MLLDGVTLIKLTYERFLNGIGWPTRQKIYARRFEAARIWPQVHGPA
jgi:hypothetical protein